MRTTSSPGSRRNRDPVWLEGIESRVPAATAAQSALIALLAVLSVPASTDLRVPAVAQTVVNGERQDVREDAAHIDDSSLTARVRVALRADAHIRARWIGVASSNGHVTLSGKANSAGARDAAEAVAAAVLGVRTVQNDLQVLAPHHRQTIASPTQRSAQ